MKHLGKLSLVILLAMGLLAMAFAPMNARVYTINTAAIAADTNFTNNLWGTPGEKADLFYQIDQATVNTISLELEVSPDGTTWYNHTVSPTLLTDNAEDASGYVADIPVHGHQFRIVANVATTDTVTPVLKIVVR